MKQWSVAKFDKDTANNLAQECGIAPFIAMLLTIRGFDTPEKIAEFLSDTPCIADPFQIKDMDKAVKRISKAVENFERICVYGDYDADGVTSTALLFSYLEAIDANVMYYIPSRENEGYGLNIEAIDYLKEQNVSLIVTVDNGIASVNEVAYAKTLGIDTVITDHHAPPEIIPNACAVVDLHQKDCKSQFKMLSGVGVAFKLVLAMEGEYADLTSLLENYADLVCIGTIGDIVSLTDENRDFVKFGLRILENSDRVGVRALLKQAGLLNKSLNATNVSFGIVPRINAAGRLGLSGDCVTLFLTDDEDKANEIAQRLGSDNTKRKDIENSILSQINSMVLANPEIVMDKIIVLDGENWHQGVIGIVAARVKEIYGKPTIIITKDGDFAKGSGRSIEGFSLYEAVSNCKEYLDHCGGHPMAVGINLKSENIDKFRTAINDYVKTNIPYDTLNVDCKLNPAMLDVSLVKMLDYLEPFGAGNPNPVFGLYNMTISDMIPLKDNKYIRLTLTRNNSKITVMSFSLSPAEFPFKTGDVVDLAVTLDINEYKGIENLTVILKDIKASQTENSTYIDSLRIFEAFCKGDALSKSQFLSIYPSRNDFALVYRFLRDNNGFSYKIDNLSARLENKLSFGKIKVILKAMNELGLIEMQEGLKTLNIEFLQVNHKVDLDSADIIKKLKEVI